MRSFFLFGSVLILFSFTSSKKEFTPPGTVKYNDTLFIDKCEIDNFSWSEYELDIKKKYGKNSAQHKEVLPDTLIWRYKYSCNEPYVIYYYRHPAYRNYPVVGISYEQALAFCKWRTERVTFLMAISKKYNGISIEYRLPSKSEWELLSFDIRNLFNADGWEVRDKKRAVNTRWMPDTSLKYKKADGLYPEIFAPVNAYEKTILGLHNMIGNVSEMVSEKGISKGGSWMHLLEDCRVGKDINYEKAEPWLGFRCVCVLRKKN
ncbi:MAG: SUMF1/EgtB/PvdO family nonheme iron enzyme [Sphingobacteriaceae bacterium]|nr:SUMF1/EgtB/PvdO family nonheme iron enzyme [Sphingobacteriaceae bacterium]